jgi:hypothetical protein
MHNSSLLLGGGTEVTTSFPQFEHKTLYDLGCLKRLGLGVWNLPCFLRRTMGRPLPWKNGISSGFGGRYNPFVLRWVPRSARRLASFTLKG